MAAGGRRSTATLALIAGAASAERARRDLGRARALALGHVRTRDRVPSATDLNIENVRAAADRLGVTLERLPGDFLRLVHGERVSYAHGSDFAFEPLVPFFVCGDKSLTARLLAERGMPVPRSAAFAVSEYAEARRFARELHAPAVTKPARSTAGGAGITLGIRDGRAFLSGFIRAASYGKDVLVEEQVAGQNVRVTILDGQVLGAVHRLPAHVEGDGATTVAGLVERKNRRWREGSADNRLLRPIQVDKEVRRILATQGITLDAVPEKGRHVALREVSNADQGGEIVDVTEALHEEHRDLALAAAATLGPVLSGVDLIVTDLRRAGDVVINEINTTPSLYVANGLHDGAPSSAAAERALRHLFDLGSPA